MGFSEIPNAEGGGIIIAIDSLWAGLNARPMRKFQRCYFVYILASLRGALYVGLTDDIRKRMNQHKSETFDGYTKKYKIDRLMYLETYSEAKVAAAARKAGQRGIGERRRLHCLLAAIRDGKI